MSISRMTTRLDYYLREPALFGTDLSARKDLWKANYIIPMANAYEDAKKRLDTCVSDAKKIAEDRKAAYEQLKGNIDLATGILFSLLGPFSDIAQNGLKATMTVSDTTVRARVLAQALERGPLSHVDLVGLVEKEKVRQFVLNQVVDRGIPAALGKATSMISPAAAQTPTGPATGTPSSQVAQRFLGVSEDMLSGQYSAERMMRGMEQVFLQLSTELNEAYMTQVVTAAQASAAQKRKWLEIATQAVIVRPPKLSMDQFVGDGKILTNQLFVILAANFLLSIPKTTQPWPNIGHDLAYTINRAYQVSGYSIITNNPKLNVNEGMNAHLTGVEWDGVIFEYTAKKIKENARGGLAVLDAYMLAMAMDQTLV
ncbi:MAG: hypothetical protein IPK63_21070 [Candidatus Competibacteraceae bacterium]|nr:hypothetical protein [Candidatus Competibacteraceae bacterium]